MQTVLVKFLIVTLAVLIAFFVAIILFQGFQLWGFKLSTSILLSIVGSILAIIKGIGFLVYRFCFSNPEAEEHCGKKYIKIVNRRKRKYRRQIDRIWAHCLEQKNLIGEISEELRNSLEQCMNNYPKENDRRKMHRRETDEIYALASL